jgi:hypothetical protein
MPDHNLSSPTVTNHGILSAGRSPNTQTPPKILNTERSFAERAVTYVDCWLARNAYTGRLTGRLWSTQLQAECEQRHQDVLSIQAARKAFGVEVIPYGLTLPTTPVVTVIPAHSQETDGAQHA